jgi:hypothetical protein
MIAILPTADATAIPPGSIAEIEVIEVAGFHGLLIDRPALLRIVVRFLIGASVAPPPRWDYSIVHRVAGAWQAPALALRLNPAWHNGPLPDAAFDQSLPALTGHRPTMQSCYDRAVTRRSTSEWLL